MQLINKFDLKLTNTLICGKPGTGKGYILKRWIVELLNEKQNIVIINPYGEYTQFVFDSMDPKTAADVLTNIASKQIDLAREIGEKKLNSYTEIEGYKPPVIIIDSIDYYMNANDFRSVESIKTALYSISSVATITGASIIMTSQRANCGSVTTLMLDRMEQILILGPVSTGDDIINRLFMDNVFIPIQDGYGIAKSKDGIFIFKKDPD